MTDVSSQSFGDYPFPPEVLAQVWATTLTGSPFANNITPLPTSSGRVAFPVVAPAGAAWTGEGQPLPPIDLNDSSYVIGVAKLAALIGLSNESVDDASIPLSDLVGQAIADSLGPVMDGGLLYGTGVPPEPDGVFAHAPAAAGGADFRSAVIQAAGEMGAAGASPASIAVFADPTVIAAEWARVSTQGVPIHDDAPSNTPLSLGPGIATIAVPKMKVADILVADVSQLYLVVREQLVLEASPDFLFSTDSLALRVKARVACACPTPNKSLRKTTITGATGTEADVQTTTHKAKD